LSEPSRRALVSRLQERCGAVRVEVCTVPEQERTRHGKFRAVVNRSGVAAGGWAHTPSE